VTINSRNPTANATEKPMRRRLAEPAVFLFE
jgi:hypothetical protein